ncbi:MAG: hypothetical protein R3B95_08060 [Nitrospirales bacterium]|nr:hypothetical protein [Nitrospirales bacterium]
MARKMAQGRAAGSVLHRISRDRASFTLARSVRARREGVAMAAVRARETCHGRATGRRQRLRPVPEPVHDFERKLGTMGRGRQKTSWHVSMAA